MPKLYIIDGNAYIHRAYHALPPLTTSKGEMVNAVYGFIRMLLKVIRGERPDYLVVTFDYPAKNFRHEAFAAYKAHRKALDDELKSQMPLVREAVKVLNVASVEKEGYEADDIIATLARRAEKDGIEVVVVSGDKDALQLVDGHITVWNETKNTYFDPEAVCQKYGLPPEKLVDMFALMGDASDNVPGIKGVGEKTAVKLLQEYGTVEKVLENAEALKGKLKELVASGKDDALKSKFLVTLCDQVPLDIHWDACSVGTPDPELLGSFLGRMEFTSLLKELTGAAPAADAASAAPSAPAAPAPAMPAVPETKREFTTHIVLTEEAFEELLGKLRHAERLSLDLETTGLDPFSAHIVGYSFAVNGDEAYYLPVGHSSIDAPRQLPFDKVRAALKPILEDPKVPKYGHNIKFDLLMLESNGITLDGVCFDTMVASYCINPSRNSHGLKAISLDYLGCRMTQIEELIGKGAKQITFDLVPVETAAPYAAADAVTVLWLADVLQEQLTERKLDRLFHEVEMPLVGVLARMERWGLRVDIPYLEKLSQEFRQALNVLQQQIFDLAGEQFNPNSPKQLSVILFEKLHLPVIRKTKTGYCTDEEVLRTLAAQHELPAKLIEFRELQKLKSTYIDALLELTDPKTHRVHSSFNQTVTATGRLSSSEPNLQNIPVRTEYGKKIRRAFIAEDGYCLFSADYSQIDLRVLAHTSSDEVMVKAFRHGEDIHSATAREVFGATGEKVDPSLRRIAKTINFGIVYGMSAFSLAGQLGISNGEAKRYIDHYFERYSGVKRWMEKIVQEARQQGYVTTLIGRIRYLPEINARNGQIRGFAERTAMNTPIQGTSADIIKIAMVHIDEYLRRHGCRTRMLVQVHDELLFEVPEDEMATVAPVLRELMENALKLEVPVLVESKTGRNWRDMEQGK